MKQVLVVAGLIVVPLLLSSCQSTQIERISRFTMSDESVKLVHGDANIPPISVLITHTTRDENNKTSIEILADGPLVDGELVLSEKVEEPTTVRISVNIGGNKDGRELTTVLKPNANVDFALKYRSRKSYRLHLVGIDDRSLDENRRFSLTGNIGTLDGFESDALEQGRVYVSVLPGITIFERNSPLFFVPSLIVDDAEFSIERDIDEPTLVTVNIAERRFGDTGSFENLPAILEPGVNYRVVPIGSRGKFAVQADRDSVHSRLVSSWQLDPAFVSLVDQWMDSREHRQTTREDQAKHAEKFVSSYQIAEECEHLKLTTEVKSQFVNPLPSVYQSAGAEIVKSRSSTLRKMMRDTQDLELARMIFDLSWSQFIYDEIYSDIDAEERIATLLEIAKKMDQAVVDEFINPELDEYQQDRDVVSSNRSLIPGQVAPDFTLTTLADEEVSLSEVLSENELVLVDFWASWCGPCIRSFPALKKMYSKYKDHGFEIVTISIDDTFEEWQTASNRHNLPWIDLGDTEGGETQGWDGKPSVTDYGVMWIPNKFLIDNKGCIVHKHFEDDELKNILASRDAGSS